jgi:hypothetical protein
MEEWSLKDTCNKSKSPIHLFSNKNILFEKKTLRYKDCLSWTNPDQWIRNKIKIGDPVITKWESMEKWNTRNIVKYFVIIESPALGEKEKTKKSIHSRDESDDDDDILSHLNLTFNWMILIGG